MAISIERHGLPETRDSDFFSWGHLRLYAPRSSKQNILIGNIESRLGLATGWGDPNVSAPDGAEDLFCLIASMRTPGGVELMLHNVASLNQIEQVLIFAATKNDDTPQGMMPRRLIHDLWTHGLSDDGIVIENGYKLKEELVKDGGIDIIRTILEKVQLHDFSDLSKTELLKQAQNIPILNFSREPHTFPEFQVRAPETLPSERIAPKEIRDTNAFNAWLKLMGEIARYGPDTKLETKSGVSVRELPLARVVLSGPKPFENLPDWTGSLTSIDLSRDSLEQYAARFMFPKEYRREIFPGVRKFFRPSNEKYLYAELIHDYPRRKSEDETFYKLANKRGVDLVHQLLQDSDRAVIDADQIAEQVLATDFRGKAIQLLGETAEPSERQIEEMITKLKTEVLLELYKPPFNQFSKVIERLKTEPDDADKTIILWDPEVHGVANSGRPCLVELSFLARDGKLFTHALFRSHDIPKGWIFNLYGVWKLANQIATETGLEVGEIVSDSESAHAYTGDLNWVSELYSKEHISKTPSTRFEAEMSDPRGNLMITTLDREIVVNLTHPITNQAMLELKAPTARQMMAQIRHHDLISQTAHALDIGAQLQAAEIALAIGQPFTQDQPHQLVRALKRQIS